MSVLLDQLARELPIAFTTFEAARGRAGLVAVDAVNGFCTPGAGALAPPAPDPRIEQMVAEINRLARAFTAAGRPVLAFTDSHVPGKPEPPYPPHCERGSGEEDLVAELKWLEAEPLATLVAKDCIDGFIGGVDLATGRNAVADWVTGNRLTSVLVTGICTDVCVMDFVLSLLSARNHGLLPGLEDIAVFEPACATYDLPRAVAEQLGLPATLAHPRALAHHAGLYFMASRGAVLVDRVV